MIDDHTTSPRDRGLATGPIGRSRPTDRRTAARVALRDRHSHRLAQLMEEREDLHGVHALADFVHDSLRWTA